MREKRAAVPSSSGAPVPSSSGAPVPSTGRAAIASPGGADLPGYSGAAAPKLSGVATASLGDLAVANSGAAAMPNSGAAVLASSRGVAVANSSRAAGLGAAIAVLVFAGGCASSPPMRFYTLSEVAPASSGAVSNAAHEIRVTRVRLPGELDRNELVQRIDANRVRIVEQDRWAAPLDEMIRRVLTANLQARTGSQPAASSAPPSSDPSAAASSDSSAAASGDSGTAASTGPRSTPSPARGETLTLDIDEFIGDTTCAVTLRASWELKGTPSSSTSVATGNETIRIAPPSAPCSVSVLPAQMSAALAELSDRVLASRR